MAYVVNAYALGQAIPVLAARGRTFFETIG